MTDAATFSRRLQRCHNIDDLRRLAKRALPTPIYDHIAGGADDEVSLRDSETAFLRYAMVPRQCAGLELDSVDMSTTVLGQDIEWPVICAPWGMQTLVHRDGEVGVAQEVHSSGTAYALSGASEVSLEAIAREVSGPLSFNLIPTRSRELMGSLMDRARDAGYGALIVTVDIPTHGNRERDRRNGLGFPDSLSPAGWLSIAMHPRWWLGKIGYRMEFANYSQYMASPGRDLEWLFDEMLNCNLDWDTMAWIAETWGGPIAIKGVLSADDARRSVDAGLTAVIVSNQGARHFDTTPAPFNALPEICDAVGDEVEVILDGGIRRGTDALKAIAIGAMAVMTARPFAYGLAAAGRQGTARALDILKSEIRRDMCFLGAGSLADLTRADLRLRPGIGAGS
jgi:L-lactate dehydrogenase (cytochrome)